MTRILCVDDDQALNECIRELLDDLGYEARGVLSGADCLYILESQSFQPDVILLDIMMEPMDGWETLKGIRGLPASARTPVVMVTGKIPTAEELNEFVSLINGYLVKPFALQYLGKEIDHVIKCVRKKDELMERARTVIGDEATLNEFCRLQCSVPTLERLSINVGKDLIDQVALARDRRRLDELKQRLLHKP